jgi:hypothetical protein
MDNKQILLAANACVTKGDNEGFLSLCKDAYDMILLAIRPFRIRKLSGNT